MFAVGYWTLPTEVGLAFLGHVLLVGVLVVLLVFRGAILELISLILRLLGQVGHLLLSVLVQLYLLVHLSLNVMEVLLQLLVVFIDVFSFFGLCGLLRVLACACLSITISFILKNHAYLLGVAVVVLLLVVPRHPFLSDAWARTKAWLGTDESLLQVQERPVDGKAGLNKGSNSGLVLPSDSSQFLKHVLIDDA